MLSPTLSALAALTLVGTTGVAVATAAEDVAPLHMAERNGVADTYAVMLDTTARSGASVRETTLDAAADARRDGVRVTDELSNIGALIVEGSPAEIAQLRRNRGVTKVSQVRTIQFVQPGKLRAEGSERSTQANVPSWGLDRIDQPDLPIDDSYRPPNNGSGVHVYIADSGISYEHSEFRGNRIGRGYDFDENDSHPQDCNSHGTHVAGIAGGNTVGVAREVTLHPLRVMNCDGKGNDAVLLKVADWLSANAVKPGVVNLSLGVELDPGESNPVDDAVEQMWKDGLLPVIAAGNSSKDACTFAPARSDYGITIGATYKNDDMSFYSNYGRCTDLFAPGSMIESADWESGGIKWNSGTSMAAPHVAGAAAIYLSRYADASPAELKKVLVDRAVRDKITLLKGKDSPNKLLQVQTLFNGPRPVPTTGPTTPPVTTPPVTTPPVTTPPVTTPPVTTPPVTTAPVTTPPVTTTTDPSQNAFSNTTSYEIRDYRTAKSPITSTYSGGNKVKLAVDLNHSCAENLELAVTTPDGTRNVVKRSSYAWRCTAWNGERSETYPMRSATNGDWFLEVGDNRRGNEGTLNGWSITFS